MCRRPSAVSLSRWWQPECWSVMDMSSSVSRGDVEAMQIPEATPMLEFDACIVHQRWEVYVSYLDLYVIFLLNRVAYVPWDYLVPILYRELND